MNWKVMLISGLLVVAILIAARICEDEAQPKTEAAQTSFSASIPAKTEAVVERAVIPCSAAKACPKGFACSSSSHACIPIPVPKADQPSSKKNDETAGDLDKLW